MANPIPLKSANSARPSSLANPAPLSNEKDSLDALLSTFSAASGPAGSASADQPDSLAGLLDGPQLAVESDLSTQPAPEGMASAKEQVNEGFTRLRNAFAATDRESLETLKSSGMFGDVRLGSNGKVQVMRKGRDGWEDFDRDKFELIGDTLDFARDAFESVISAGGMIGGGVSGAVAAAPEGAAVGAGVGTVAGPLGSAAGAITGGGLAALGGGAIGAAAGGAAGAVIATKAGDWVAEHLLGVPQDPTRNKTAEASTAAIMGGGFNILASSIARRAEVKSAQAIQAKNTLEYARNKTNEVTQMVKDVADSGIKLGEDGNFRLDAHQAVGNGIPDLNVTAKEMSRNGGFRQFRKEMAGYLMSAYDSIASSVAATSGKGADLGSDFVLDAKDIRAAQGKLIGSFRALADEKLAGKKMPAQRAVQAVDELFTSMGGKLESRMQNGKRVTSLIDPTPEIVMRNYPSLTKGQAGALIGEIKSLVVRIKKGGGDFSVDQMQEIYESLSTKIDRSINTTSGKPYGNTLIKVKNAIRDDWTDAMGAVLPDSQKEAYRISKQRFSDIAKASSDLGALLQNENISRNALVSTLFEGKNALSKAKSARTIIQESNPGLWDDLSKEYLNKLKFENTKMGDNGYNVVDWNAISKKMGSGENGMGSEMRQIILDGAGLSEKGFNALVGLGQRFQNADFAALPSEAKRGVFRNIFNLLMPTMATTKGDAASSLLEGMGKNQQVMIWLKDGGLEEVMHNLPGLKPAAAQRLRQWITQWEPIQKVVESKGAQVASKVGGAVEDGTKKVMKTVIRRKAQGAMSDMMPREEK